MRAARVVGGIGDSGDALEGLTLFKLAGRVGRQRSYFTSPDFGMDNGGGLGLFLGFLVCHDFVGGIASIFRDSSV